MKNLLRAGLASTAAVLLSVSFVSEASAVEADKVSVSRNGQVKATAIWWGGGRDELCADLKAGYKATASINGNSVTDWSEGGDQNCVWINNVNAGQNYTLTISWWAHDGVYKTNSMTVKG